MGYKWKTVLRKIQSILLYIYSANIPEHLLYVLYRATYSEHAKVSNFQCCYTNEGRKYVTVAENAGSKLTLGGQWRPLVFEGDEANILIVKRGTSWVEETTCTVECLFTHRVSETKSLQDTSK